MVPQEIKIEERNEYVLKTIKSWKKSSKLVTEHLSSLQMENLTTRFLRSKNEMPDDSNMGFSRKLFEYECEINTLMQRRSAVIPPLLLRGL